MEKKGVNWLGVNSKVEESRGWEHVCHNHTVAYRRYSWMKKNRSCWIRFNMLPSTTTSPMKPQASSSPSYYYRHVIIVWSDVKDIDFSMGVRDWERGWKRHKWCPLSRVKLPCNAVGRSVRQGIRIVKRSPAVDSRHARFINQFTLIWAIDSILRELMFAERQRAPRCEDTQVSEPLLLKELSN